MTIILARLRAEHANADEPPAVHAYRLLDDAESTPTLHAACGHTLEPGHGERVNTFVGAPCTPCLLMLAAASDQITTSEPEQVELDVSDPAGNYAVALRGEHVSHLLPQRRIIGTLDGRSVVQTACGCMAWGPLQHPPQWPVCDECSVMPSGAIS